MSTQTKLILGGVAGFLVLSILGWWIAALVVLGVVAIPVVGYMMLDPSQRKRVRAQGRKRLGS
ncbi:hypothetical protein GCM10023085_25570 [Actinomadura viridis]|uniref:Uncharacterized protein n=1 Tax=Actinomadura viridis TaxID=58110 RepID=A0A931GLH2_9ACTN|nr:hypothetical protein [Actinomadura viridis]MBG6087456.1 hypothetical protein [Actinomadura viridis]